MNVRLFKSNEFLIKQILISFGKSRILSKLSRFVLIISVAFFVAILTNWGNDPPHQKQSLKSLETSLELTKILSPNAPSQHHYNSATIAGEGSSWQFIEENHSEFINSWKTILFLTGGFTTWVMVEALLYKKYSVLGILKSDITSFTAYIQPLNKQFIQKFNTIKDLIQQQLQTLAVSISYQQQKDKQIQILEQKIAEYENQLFLARKQQQQYLQQLHQELVDLKSQKKSSEEIIQKQKEELNILKNQAEEF